MQEQERDKHGLDSSLYYIFSPEFASIEAFLDENPDFFQNYLIRKATRSQIDAWLVSHALPPGSTSLPPFSPFTDEPPDKEPQSANRYGFQTTTDRSRVVQPHCARHEHTLLYVSDSCPARCRGARAGPPPCAKSPPTSLKRAG